MTTLVRAALFLALMASTPLAALAQQPASIALAPLETLGTEARSSPKITALLTKALSEIPGHTVISDKDVRTAIKKQPQLRACAGRAGCLADLGKKVGAVYVVFGEVGGLGSAEVVYLELIDVAKGESVRSTTLELGGGDTATTALGAAYQLLAPERYVGTLEAKVDIDGASVYVDGQRVAKSPAQPVALAVGSHAVRVNHPEFRDYVRFVDIEFNKVTTIEVDLQEYPIVATDLAEDPELAAKAGPGGPNVLYRGQEPTPWYRRWYTVAGAGTAVLVASAVVVGVLASGIDADSEKIIENPR